MRQKKRFRLAVESLEGRLTPSGSFTFTTGKVTIVEDNRAAQSVTVTQLAATSYRFAMDGATVGTFNGVTSISITQGNGAGDTDTITSNVAGLTFAASVTVNTGGGNNDAVTFSSTGAGDTYSGKINATTGGGTGDSVTLTGVTTFNGAMTITGAAGNGVNYQDSTTGGSIAGALNLTNLNNYAATGGTISGGITINNANLGVAATINTSGGATYTSALNYSGGGVANTVTLGSTSSSDTLTGGADTITVASGSTINGNLSYTNTDGNTTSVTLTGATIRGNLTYSTQGSATITMGGAAATTINGTATLSFASATNTYNLGAGAANTYTIGGTLSITAGDSANSITLGNGTNGTNGTGTVGALTVNLGNGANSLTLANGFTVNTDVSYNGGSGGNTINFGQGGAGATGTINGNVTIGGAGGLGNGANSWTVNTGFAINGTNVSYTGGTNSDSVVIDNGITNAMNNITINFGGGTQNLQLGPPGAPGTTDGTAFDGNSFIINFATSGTKTFTNNADESAMAPGSFQVNNFP